MSDFKQANIEQATFGAGCFWCVEALFETIPGVIDVQSGYSGGHDENPNYKSVCSGTTGHAEVVNIKYNKLKISYEKLLEFFWEIHDPTTLNRQGADVGTQYRSAIYYHNEEQRLKAIKSKDIMNSNQQYNGKIVTEISPFVKMYIAENYHQNYYKLNPNAPYCKIVIKEKLNKLIMSKKF
tara:strand:- start:107 stop:649 length:543 start_codon:yes stop_codon:yes gene_type:complete